MPFFQNGRVTGGSNDKDMVGTYEATDNSYKITLLKVPETVSTVDGNNLTITAKEKESR